MDIYLYNDKDTLIHRLHPITKIVNLLLLFAICMTFNHPTYVFVIMVFVIFIAVTSHSMANIRKILYLLIMLIVFCGVLWPLFLRGNNLLWKLGPISIYRESLFYAVAMGLRLDTMLMCGMIFLTCTRIEEFTAGLNKMGMPFSVSFTLSLAFRLVPTFASTSATVVQAQKSRGLDLESGWIFSRLKKHIPLFIPIFIYAVRNADLLAMALESKSFGLRRDRSYYREFRFTFTDLFTIMFLAALFGLCLYMRINQMGYVLPRL